MQEVAQPAGLPSQHVDPAPVDPRFQRPDVDGAAERLLDAAEKLVAQRGLTVTDRAIVVESGHRNNSAIAYHFGNRQGLLDAVWQRRTARVEVRRLAYLHSLGLTLDDVHRLDQQAALSCWVGSVTGEMASLDPSYWARFNERVLQERPLNFVDWVTADLERFPGSVPLDSLLSVFGRLRELTLAGQEPAAGNRVALTVRFVIGALAAWERDQEAVESAGQSLVELSSELVQLALAILNASGPVLDKEQDVKKSVLR
jgi:AcrR family transcriptional regulator